MSRVRGSWTWAGLRGEFLRDGADGGTLLQVRWARNGRAAAAIVGYLGADLAVIVAPAAFLEPDELLAEGSGLGAFTEGELPLEGPAGIESRNVCEAIAVELPSSSVSQLSRLPARLPAGSFRFAGGTSNVWPYVPAVRDLVASHCEREGLPAPAGEVADGELSEPSAVTGRASAASPLGAAPAAGADGPDAAALPLAAPPAAAPRGGGGGRCGYIIATPPVRPGAGDRSGRRLAAELEDLRAQVGALTAAAAVALPAHPPPGRGADPLGSEPRPGLATGPARPSRIPDPQFFEEGARLGLADADLQRLLGLASSAPSRMLDPAARTVGAGTGIGTTHVTTQFPQSSTSIPAPSNTPLPASPVPPASATAAADPLNLLLQQNQMLIALLASGRASGSSSSQGPSVLDLLSGGGAATDLLDERRVQGARGCAARAALIEEMRAHPAAVTAAVRKNLARAVDKQPASLEPADMRAYFTRDVPLGSFTCLTYFSFLLAKLWEQGELLTQAAANAGGEPTEMRDRIASLQALISLGCVFADQVAAQGGLDYQVGWLLTGLEEPPFATTTLHKPRPNGPPHGRLVEPTWFAAQLAYLQDLKLMTERLKQKPPKKGGGKDGKDAAE